MDTSLRLSKIVTLIDQGVIADIGCDHALVCLGAIEQKKAQKAYACDLRLGPLRQALSNIEAHGLQEQIVIRLQDGIQNLPEDVEEIIICGMGGKLIIDILSWPIPSKVNTLLLSPHKDAKALRLFLINQGWTIVEEWMIKDGHFYPIIKARRKSSDQEKNQDLDDEESLLLGFHVKADDDYLAFLSNQQMTLQKRIQNLSLDHPARKKFERDLNLVQNRLFKLLKF